MRARAGRPPGLAVVLAGNNPASEVYVRSKTATAEGLGIYNETLTPAPSITTDELKDLIRSLNARAEIDGILVQLPLPAHIDSDTVLLTVSPDKDVDGFHPYNAGLLATGRSGLRPCTPAGIIQMLRRYEIPVAGKNAVVVGRSDIVGKPMALMLLEANATVTICHSRTRDLPSVCREADLLVAAVGRPGMVEGSWIKPGAVVVDVGINRVEDLALGERIFAAEPEKLARLREKGHVLSGDVRFGEALEVASAVTPVPGGVGPLTIAGLMRNTLQAANALGA